MMPVYFFSHGAPNLIIRPTPAFNFFNQLCLETIPEVQAILVISAHWMTNQPSVTGNSSPSIIYDFQGFDKQLYQKQYPVLGSPQLAQDIIELIKSYYPKVYVDEARGLDHGVWIPLSLAASKAQIPVIQLSIQPHQDALYHYNLGKCLQSFSEKGVIIIGSGSITHNLRAVFGGDYTDTPPQVTQFNDWVYEMLTQGNDEALLEWEKHPYGLWNHPTNDHFLPLFSVLGATAHLNSRRIERIHHSFDYKVLSMDCYQFSNQ